MNEAFPNLASTFAGTVIIGAGGREFVALTLRTADKTIYSSLPSGATTLPAPHYYQILDVFERIRDAARSSELVPNTDSITLTVSPEKDVQAWGGANGIQINLALAELIADSPSELAFVIGHEIGHVFQFQNGIEPHEKDADMIGFVLSLLAGYDPYAGAGFLAKAAMATGTAGLTIQNWEATYSHEEAHGSFNDCLDNIYETIEEMCTSPALSDACAVYKDAFHPHFPPNALLTTVAP